MIHVENMSFQYPSGQHMVFDSVSINITSGHIYGLLGKNGVGKSTLFRLISGINELKKGAITTLGMNPFDRDPNLLARLFLIPEDMAFPDLSIRKFAQYYGAFYPNYDPAALEQYLEKFDVPNHVVSKMSLGQRKKAMISFALSLNTDILLMDEPTNGLDIPSKRIFRSCLADLDMSNRLMMISTHQVRDLEELIDAVIIVDDRHISLSATFSSLLQQYHFGELNDDMDIVYEERIGGRRCGVSRLRSEDKPDKTIDMELLFNAAVSGTITGEIV